MEADASGLAKLREPFPAEHTGKLPRVTCKDCRDASSKCCSKHTKSKCAECDNWITGAHMHLDYVGHGAVTDRLLAVDPAWTWEPVAWDDDGLPRMERTGKGDPISLWIRLTVCGVTRLGVGTCEPSKFDAEKVLIGDALRNAAMRFGVALDLWIKGHAEDDERRAETGAPSRTRRSQKGVDGDTGEVAAKEAWEGQHAEYKRLSDAVAAMKDKERAATIVEWVVASKIGPDAFTVEQRDEIEAMIADKPAGQYAAGEEPF